MRKAAEQGDARAQLSLGFRFAFSQGVTDDDVQSFAWLTLAAAQGRKEALPLKNKLLQRMADYQIARAQELCRSLEAQIGRCGHPH